MRTILTLVALLGMTTTAFAQARVNTPAPTDKSLYTSEAQLQAIMKAVPPKDGKPGSFSNRLFSASTFSTAFIRLNAPDKPHAHGAWSEVFVVKEGDAILETGGTITGGLGTNSATHGAIFTEADGSARAPAAPPPPTTPARQPTPGDISGDTIVGGHRQRVGPGDVILVPAGVAHVWIQVDKPIVYLDVKFPKAN